MRESRRAERLLSLITSPDNAAGIAGDLSEERDHRGSAWFWRQVLGTMLSLTRGVLVESPFVVVPLVLAGYVLLQALAWGVVHAELYLLNALQATYGLDVFIGMTAPLFNWPGKLLVGMAMVAVAQRRGMVACVLLAALVVVSSIFSACVVYSYANFFPLQIPVRSLGTSFLLLLGGALIRRRLNRKLLPLA